LLFTLKALLASLSSYCGLIGARRIPVAQPGGPSPTVVDLHPTINPAPKTTVSRSTASPPDYEAWDLDVRLIDSAVTPTQSSCLATEVHWLNNAAVRSCSSRTSA
jgi:hypothetical protein